MPVEFPFKYFPVDDDDDDDDDNNNNNNNNIVRITEEKSSSLEETKKKCLVTECFLAHIHFSRLYFIHKRVHTNSEAMYIVLPLYF